MIKQIWRSFIFLIHCKITFGHPISRKIIRLQRNDFSISCKSITAAVDIIGDRAESFNQFHKQVFGRHVVNRTYIYVSALTSGCDNSGQACIHLEQNYYMNVEGETHVRHESPIYSPLQSGSPLLHFQALAWETLTFSILFSLLSIFLSISLPRRLFFSPCVLYTALDAPRGSSWF